MQADRNGSEDRILGDLPCEESLDRWEDILKIARRLVPEENEKTGWQLHNELNETSKPETRSEIP